MKVSVLLLLAASLGACAGSSGTAADVDAAAGDGDGDGGDDGGDGGGGGDAGTASCTVGALQCQDPAHERECVDGAGGGGPVWVERACDLHEYCLDDRCVPACVDECALGDTRAVGGSTETCGLYSEDAGGFVAPGAGGHDLARKHLAYVRAHHLANGYVANTVFSSAAHTAPIAYTGTVDAAEWTGVYLAAEALRALTTRSAATPSRATTTRPCCSARASSCPTSGPCSARPRAWVRYCRRFPGRAAP